MEKRGHWINYEYEKPLKIFSLIIRLFPFTKQTHMLTKLSKMSLYSTKPLKITEESDIPFSCVGECVQFSHALTKTELTEQCLMSD